MPLPIHRKPFPKSSNWGGKLVYGTGYTAAFVIVFPAALIFAAIPRGNALVQGLLDGSAAERDKVQGWLG